MQMMDGGGVQGWGPHECCGYVFFFLKVVLKSKANDKSSCGGKQETIVASSTDFAHLPAVIHH